MGRLQQKKQNDTVISSGLIDWFLTQDFPLGSGQQEGEIFFPIAGEISKILVGGIKVIWPQLTFVAMNCKFL